MGIQVFSGKLEFLVPTTIFARSRKKVRIILVGAPYGSNSQAMMDDLSLCWFSVAACLYAEQFVTS